MRTEIIKQLRQYKLEDTTPIFVIEFEGKRLKFNSTKSAWTSLAAAKNALRNAVWVKGDNLKLIKEMEDEGIIKYIKL